MRSAGYVFCREGVWYIRFSFRGREYRESSRSTRKADAVALLDRRRREVQSGLTNVRATFDDLVALIEHDYATNGRRSVVDLRGRIAWLRRSFGKMRPQDITHASLLRYVQNRHASASTVRYELMVLGRMFTLGMRAGVIVARPLMPSVRVSNTRTGFLTEAQLERVIAHLPHDLRAPIRFASITGWRIGEIRSLTWAEVDDMTVRLEPGTTKSGLGRVFPFAAHPGLARLMADQRAYVDSVQRRERTVVRWVFPRSDGGQLGDFRKVWGRACEAAGVPGSLVHDLRRYAARRMVRSGIPERIVQALCGWRTRSLLDRYNVVDEADLADAVRKLAHQTAHEA